jgi:hypothetical protein
MTHEGLCLGGPKHGQAFAAETNQIEVLREPDIVDWATARRMEQPVQHRYGYYYHHYIKLMSGDKVGIWDWAGWM